MVDRRSPATNFDQNLPYYAELNQRARNLGGEAERPEVSEVARHKSGARNTDEPDMLVPDTVVVKELGVTSMTLWRWSHDPTLDFPPQIKVKRRNFRSRKMLEAWKQRMLERAIEQRRLGGGDA